MDLEHADRFGGVAVVRGVKSPGEGRDGRHLVGMLASHAMGHETPIRVPDHIHPVRVDRVGREHGRDHTAEVCRIVDRGPEQVAAGLRCVPERVALRIGGALRCRHENVPLRRLGSKPEVVHDIGRAARVPVQGDDQGGWRRRTVTLRHVQGERATLDVDGHDLPGVGRSLRSVGRHDRRGRRGRCGRRGQCRGFG